MNIDLTHDLLEQQVIRRFKISNSGSSKPVIDEHLYIDLLCVFNNPDSFNAEDFKDYPLQSTLLYLKKTHELYQTRSLQEIMMAIERLDRTDAVLAKLQSSLSSFFTNFKNDLEDHIKEEESKLFPYVEELLDSKFSNGLRQSPRNTILRDFVDKHDDHLERDLHNLVQAMQELLDTYSDSFAFRMLLNRLSVLELDLRVHAKIEEEVLVPKALELEKEIFG